MKLQSIDLAQFHKSFPDAAQLFKKFDHDGDGTVTTAEIRARSQRDVDVLVKDLSALPTKDGKPLGELTNAESSKLGRFLYGLLCAGGGTFCGMIGGLFIGLGLTSQVAEAFFPGTLDVVRNATSMVGMGAGALGGVIYAIDDIRNGNISEESAFGLSTLAFVRDAAALTA